MNKNLFILSLCIATMACTGNKKQADTKAAVATTEAAPQAAVYSLDSLLSVADRHIDQTVTVVGYVTHTCKHAGKRCFITGESQSVSMRVEAKGDIGGFNRELVGSKLEITGVLKERRLSKEYIDEMEKNVELKKKEDGAAESCAAELSNIADMRRRMKEQGKDYYSIYYMEGLTYNVLD